ncbi:class I SAM-dependent methyltransferase [Fulvivirga sp. 29W222]|uniref:Class I SAM-dependent methyltransferase n=1 Tax=Fulvivirga marina TaxID=2494733 RepID=A0A937KD17_9BACT|nr:class I SAM-dependent methyltransferase [Fulvivirga marina]MBL6445773.1 class I SAM-dependent methyltransferase [Fulvivirga marina]
MLAKKEQAILRSKIFRHLDGIVTAPSAYTLKQYGVTDFLLVEKRADLKTIATQFNANDGYLNVALRAMCSQGWLDQQVDNEADQVTFEINDHSEIAFDFFSLYKDAVELLVLSEKYHNRKFEMEPFQKLEVVFSKLKHEHEKSAYSNPLEEEVHQQILTHIEGIVVGPTLVHLGMSGMFHKYFMETRFKAEEFHKDADGFGRLLDILTHLKWFNKINNTYEFTEEGLFFAKRASAYGVTVSYIPTLRKLNDLIFGDPIILKGTDTNGNEKHVDREMNVWGSGGAHAAYFKVVDEIIIEIFNRPIDEQPKGILDMGCGNGAFLKHLFNVVANQTQRGRVLEEHPLLLIGVDYNEAALKVSKANLIQADIWAKIIWGDIGKPDILASDLKEAYNIDLKDLLNVRTFLDHNRIWEEPEQKDDLRISSSTGAYCSEGRRLSNNLVSESLRQHFKRWTPYVKQYGLLLIELHTVSPELVAQNLGKTAATAYDVTHGYSDQYIVEVEEFIKVLQEAGLSHDKEMFRKYPDSDLATVTINLFKA